jgi:hypothetical protein
MVPITREDEQLFGAALMAAKMGRIRPILAKLRKRYEEEWDNPQAGYPYALAMVGLLMSGREDRLEDFDYTEVVETLSDLLYHEPDHWLGRFLRIQTRTLLPTDADEYQQYIAAERTRAAEDAAELIARQADSDWQPWYACAYLLAARLEWEGERDVAKVGELITAAAAHPATPVPFGSLGGVMCEAFAWYYVEPGVPELETAGTLMDALFPGQPVARRVRAVRAVR